MVSTAHLMAGQGQKLGLVQKWFPNKATPTSPRRMLAHLAAIACLFVMTLLSGTSEVLAAGGQSSSPPLEFPSRDEDPWPFLRRLLDGATIRDEPGVRNPSFCRRTFLPDLLAGRNIRFIQPTVRAASIDDPILDRFRAICSGIPLGEFWSNPFKEGDRMFEDEPPSRDFFVDLGLAYNATKNIEIYELDTTNGSTSALGDVVLYGEGVSGKSGGISGGVYKAIKSGVCDSSERYSRITPSQFSRLIYHAGFWSEISIFRLDDRYVIHIYNAYTSGRDRGGVARFGCSFGIDKR